ncbi:MAG: glycosyltransferase 87 family protein [Actinomycetota bacterium]
MSQKKFAVVLALCATAVTLVAGYLLKEQCISKVHLKNRWDLTRDCYSDITMGDQRVIYGWRPTPFRLPFYYKPFSRHGIAYRDNNLEYPALTGLFITGVNAFVPNSDPGGFLLANAIGLSIAALCGAAALALIVKRPRRILLLALAPEMIAYGFHNWDLLPVGFTAVALYAFVRKRDGLAGLMLGLGAAAKLYPLFFIPVLALARILEQRPGTLDAIRRKFVRSWKLLVWSFVGLALPNLIVLAYAGSAKLLFPWRWQSQRLPNSETHWLLIYQYLHGFGRRAGPGPHFAVFVQTASLGLFVVLAAFYLYREASRPKFRPVTACFIVILIYLATAKVLSPQYMIWLLPFFVLVSIPWWGYALFVFADLFELAGIWNQNLHNSLHTSFPYLMMVGGVAMRYVMMLTVMWLAYRRGSDLVVESARDQLIGDEVVPAQPSLA